MMTRLLRRVSRSLSLTLMATALATSGCDAPVDHEPAPTIERSGGSQQMIQALAQDADFHTLIDVTATLAGELDAAQKALPDETIDSIAKTITHPSFAETTDPATLVEDLGGDPAHLPTIRNLSLLLIERYNLQEATSDEIKLLIGSALQTDSGGSHLDGAIENELHDVEGDVDTTVDECEAQCIAEYSIAAGIAVSAYIAALVGAVAAGPAGPIVAVIALAEFNYAMAVAQSALNRCMDECNGIFSDDCGWDHDCADDEFCWKGVLGIGKNECRDEKSQGETCSRDGQCKSGCCKFHLWSNPVSPVCRPSDKCD